MNRSAIATPIREDIRIRFLAAVARADQRVAAEWAALKAGPIKPEPWNRSGASPEKIRERQRRNAAKRSRQARAARQSQTRSAR